MFQNYIKIALRNLMKHKAYSLINIIGLSLGIACCIMIFLFVADELSYDRQHDNADQIYRVVTDMNVGGKSLPLAVTPFPMAPALQEDFPEIKETVRIVKWGNPLLSKGDDSFYEQNFFWAEPAVFDVFSFPLQKGDPATALRDPNSVLLTQETAIKYFGDADPLGQTLTYGNDRELMVTGVLANLPGNSHIQFDFLGSFATLEDILGPGGSLQVWHAFWPIYTFIKVDNPVGDIPALTDKLPQFVDAHMHDDIAKSIGRTYAVHLQPLTDIYLHSQRLSEMASGNIIYVYTFSAIAVFILLIACINFMNLATARSARRAKEVGMRKVLGAFRFQLIYQFLGESVFISLISLPLAFVLVNLFLPVFNDLSGKELMLSQLGGPIFFLLAGLCILFVGLGAGSYPAFFLSSFKPIVALKGRIASGVAGRSPLRRALVIFQFGISIVLIVSTAVVYNQLDFVRNKKLGFDKDQVIVVSSSDQEVQAKYDVLYEQFLQSPHIANVSAANVVPGKSSLATPVLKVGGSNDEKWEMSTLPIDPDFVETLGIKLAAGRNYDRDITSDTLEAFLLNEAAVGQFGWQSPEEAIGKQIEWLGLGTGLRGTVIGVVEDYHFASLHAPIAPALMVPGNLWPMGTNFIMVRSRTSDLSNALAYLKDTWQQVIPDRPFQYTFLDEDFGALYQSEEKLGKIFIIFATLAILIACLGLFGLSAFAAEQRTKEIGIRKVLGATAPNIVYLLSKEFVVLVVAANAIAWPAAYFIMDYWLQNFAYKVGIGWEVFALAAMLALFIALLTVSFQSIKAAFSNPVKTLRYE